uniref:B30.2/SPRY domain-containing protein n=1 Tax=Oryzias latipes TaxID=8090 RepID=A0A3B3HVD6_ORYLA
MATGDLAMSKVPPYCPTNTKLNSTGLSSGLDSIQTPCPLLFLVVTDRIYSELTLDLNTAHPHLELSAANRKATFTVNTGGYHSHPDRFTSWIQVLSRESLTGRHYWEVKWTGGAIYVAVAYKNVGTSQFGSDDKSWALYCDRNSYIFYHKDMQTCLSGPGSSRVGVYLDHGAGVLAFYSVSETMTLLHRVQTTFTQPLHLRTLIKHYRLGSPNKQTKM